MKNFNEKNSFVAGVSAFFVAIIVGFLSISINAYLFQITWNLIMPHKFGLTELGFFDSCYIILLSHILFSSSKNGFNFTSDKKQE